MKKKFKVEYCELDSDGEAHCYGSYYYHQDIFQKLTLRDVKEFVKEQRYKEHKPVCTCYLLIYRYKKNRDFITECYENFDSTYLEFLMKTTL